MTSVLTNNMETTINIKPICCISPFRSETNNITPNKEVTPSKQNENY